MHCGNEKHFLERAGSVSVLFLEIRGLPDFYTDTEILRDKWTASNE
jgi:hypothetical protein